MTNIAVSNMSISRRTFCTVLVVSAMSNSRLLAGAAPVTVTDMAGRTVVLSRLPRRIILLNALDLFTMSLLYANPAELVTAWATVARFDSKLLSQQLQRGQNIKMAGQMAPGSISAENLIRLNPDLIVTTNWITPAGSPVTEHLQQAGIPLLYSEILNNDLHHQVNMGDPFSKLAAYLRMWGQLLPGAAQKASDFIGFVDERLQHVNSLLRQVKPIPVYLELKSIAGDCCWAAGRSKWGQLLQLAGGETLAVVNTAWAQKLSLEQLISEPQEVYIATGGGWNPSDADGRPAIGPGLDISKARAGLNRLLQRPGFNQLASVKAGRVYAVWTGLLTIPPLNLLFVELAAKWLHPGMTQHIDPSSTLTEINKRFLAIPLPGPLWMSMRE